MLRDWLWKKISEKHELKIIAAIDDRDGVSKEGKIPWHVPEDLEHFWETIKGSTVIGGERTIREIRTLLEKADCTPYTTSRKNLEAVYELDSREVWVIGGAKVFNGAAPYVDAALISHIPGKYDCDAVFNLDLLPPVKKCRYHTRDTFTYSYLLFDKESEYEFYERDRSIR